MGVEAENNTIPDEFLQKTYEVDKLFAEIDMPLSSIGSTAISRHTEIDPLHQPPPKTREQEAAEFFRKRILPAPFTPPR